MLLQQFRKELKNLLKPTHPVSYSKEVDQVLASSLNLTLNNIFFSDSFINESTRKRITALVDRLVQGEPLAYVLGMTSFYGCNIRLNRHVLIPRQETEILTNLIVNDISKNNRQNGLLFDLCTGSGCIGIALKKKFPTLKVILNDLSNEAITLAGKNARENGVDVELREGDFLSIFNQQKADVIVCNPPYVTEKEYETLEPSVKNFEPKTALVAQDNGLYFYNELAKKGRELLNSDGVMWLEIGYTQGDELKKIFPFVQIIKDLSGHDRFARVEFP